jgi:hypothetical protein
MTDNRIHLRCKVCGEQICLGGQGAGFWYLKRTAEEINEFINEHLFACEINIERDASLSFELINDWDLAGEVGE